MNLFNVQMLLQESCPHHNYSYDVIKICKECASQAILALEEHKARLILNADKVAEVVEKLELLTRSEK